MVLRNPNFQKLQAGYLFPEIHKRKLALLEKKPDADLINLGIGDTTAPLIPHVVKGLVDAAIDLGQQETYTGYGKEQGLLALREKIAHKWYNHLVQPHEIYIHDGAKCDVGRLQILFHSESNIAVQDPTYPVYVDTSVIAGRTKDFDPNHKLYSGTTYLPCTPENGFFPDLKPIKDNSLIFFCSPNNPTGAVATKEQLKTLVDVAKKTNSIILFDTAYAAYIQDPHLPRSIYEIEGAREVSIEINSFSKLAGFTGVRLGWTVVPDELTFEDGIPVKRDFSRIHSTFFNGASNIAQKGGVAVLEALDEIQKVITYYLDNTKQLKDAMSKLGYPSFGGQNAPYVWVKVPFKDSWDAFDYILEQLHIVTTPGSGFGPAGSSFIRLSGLGKKTEIDEAIARFSEHRF